MTIRYRIPQFDLANAIYTGAILSLYTVSAGVKTTTLATLYSGQSGTGVLLNPQTLDSDGKLQQDVYTEVPVIGTISGLTIADHDTGILRVLGDFQGDWVTATVYYAGEIVKDVAAGANTLNLYYCNEDHTAGVWATDLAAAKWALYVNVSDAVAAQVAAEAAQAAAETAQTAAETAQTAAELAETHAETAETNAASSASAASTSETNAATSETNAATSETNAADDAATVLATLGALAGGDFFEYDSNLDVMPTLLPTTSTQWDLDGNSDIQPVT